MPSDCLKQIIHDKPPELKYKYPKIVDKKDPKMYDIKNYDIHSFDIGRGHSCPGTEIDAYLKTINRKKGGSHRVSFVGEFQCNFCWMVSRFSVEIILNFYITCKNSRPKLISVSFSNFAIFLLEYLLSPRRNY